MTSQSNHTAPFPPLSLTSTSPVAHHNSPNSIKIFSSFGFFFQGTIGVILSSTSFATMRAINAVLMEPNSLCEQVKLLEENATALLRDKTELQLDLQTQRAKLIDLAGKLQAVKEENKTLEANYEFLHHSFANATAELHDEKTKRQAAEARVAQLEGALERAQAETQSEKHKDEEKSIELSAYRCAFHSSYKLVKSLEECHDLYKILKYSFTQCRALQEKKKKLREQAETKARSPEGQKCEETIAMESQGAVNQEDVEMTRDSDSAAKLRS